MHVSAGRTVGGVDVCVSVDPDQSNFLILAAIESATPATVPAAIRMIAAESDGHFPCFQCFYDKFSVLGAGRGDFL